MQRAAEGSQERWEGASRRPRATPGTTCSPQESGDPWFVFWRLPLIVKLGFVLSRSNYPGVRFLKLPSDCPPALADSVPEFLFFIPDADSLGTDSVPVECWCLRMWLRAETRALCPCGT